MKRRYPPNYKGFLYLHRAVLFLYKTYKVTASEFAYFLTFLLQSDYDKRHTETYSLILRDDDQIAEIMQVNPSTVNRQKKKLLRKGLIQKIRGNYCINSVVLFTKDTRHLQTQVDIAKLQIIYSLMHLSSTELVDKVAIMQMGIMKQTITPPSKKARSRFSTRDDLGSSPKENLSMNEDVDPDDIPF